MTRQFKPGDFVRRKNGNVIYVVVEELRCYEEVKLRDTRTNKTLTLHESYLVLHNSPPGSDMKNPNTLYSFTDTSGMVIYGQHIGTNSQGEYVVEVKGSGQIVAMNKDALTEVLPYTIEVRFGDSGTQGFCYVSEEGAFAEKDFVMALSSSGAPRIGVVTKVNTRERHATEVFAGRKVVFA